MLQKQNQIIISDFFFLELQSCTIQTLYPWTDRHSLQISNTYARMLSNILRKFDLIGKLRNFPNHGIQKMQIH